MPVQFITDLYIATMCKWDHEAVEMKWTTAVSILSSQSQITDHKSN